MNTYELYHLDSPDTVEAVIEANTPEAALKMAAGGFKALHGGIVGLSIPLLTLATPGGVLGVRKGTPSGRKEATDEW